MFSWISVGIWHLGNIVYCLNKKMLLHCTAEMIISFPSFIGSREQFYYSDAFIFSLSAFYIPFILLVGLSLPCWRRGWPRLPVPHFSEGCVRECAFDWNWVVFLTVLTRNIPCWRALCFSHGRAVSGENCGFICGFLISLTLTVCASSRTQPTGKIQGMGSFPC